jgi:hypothetical protein
MKLGASDRWRSSYKWLTRFQVLAALALSIVTVLAKYEIPAGANNLWSTVVSVVQDSSIYIIVVANFILWTAHVLKNYVGNPWAWDTVKALLEEFRTDVFAGATLNASHDRVTLFKKKDVRWRFLCCPSNDWLCAAERTGHMTRRRRKWMRANDDGQRYEGVAGATWCLGRTVLKDQLPQLTREAAQSEIDLYAKETFIGAAYIKKKLRAGYVFPRSLCGIIVEVNSRPWGVIVIDSSLEKLPDQAVIEAFYRKNAKTLGKLLAVL